MCEWADLYDKEETNQSLDLHLESEIVEVDYRYYNKDRSVDNKFLSLFNDVKR